MTTMTDKPSNDREYLIMKALIIHVREKLDSITAVYAGPEEVVTMAVTQAAFIAQINSLRAKLYEYELANGIVASLGQLPDALIHARKNVAKLSWKDLADKLKIDEKTVRAYEATSYMNVTLSRILEIAKILGVHQPAP